MSAFDENPFEDEAVFNPFQDPSVQQVTQQSSNIQKGIDTYNPFDPNSGNIRPTVARGASNPPLQSSSVKSGPAIMVATQETSLPPPAYSSSGQTQINLSEETEKLRQRQEELDRKAAELERREAQINNAPPINVRRNNWPPFPDNFCFQPCFYQDFAIDIPFEFQRIVRLLYYLWMYHACLMCVNVVGGLLILIHTGNLTVFCLGIVYVFIFTPFSYLCWFRPAYKAFRNDSSMSFMVFFFMFFFQFIITVIHSIGTKDSGTCGIFTAINVYDSTPSGVVTAIFVFLIAIGFCTAAAMDLILISKIHKIYRSSGASMAKAQAELTDGFLSNQHVRNMAASAATSAMRSQFQGDQPQQQTDRRY